MPYFPTVDATDTYQQVTDVFMGYNHNLKIRDGSKSGKSYSMEFYDMSNLCSDYYPVLANRRKRGTVAQLTSPGGIMAKESLAYVDNGKLYYAGTEVPGIALSAGEKQLISMGAYLLIWPDKKYVNTKDLTDCGDMEESVTTTGSIAYSLCEVDGTNIANIATTQPASPTSGQYWMDTTQVPHTLRQYSAASSSWVAISTVYIKISATGIGAGFHQYDGVKLSGISYAGTTAGIADQSSALNGDNVIYAAGDDYIVIIGILDVGYIQSSSAVTVSRSIPDMDYVCEAQNRVWGCKYGMVSGKAVNELYCCKLGDFKNWSCYLGISTDSWAASVGSDGPWTGCINYMGNPTFFKENSIHKVFISPSGAHQVTETKARGVQNGSSKSLCVVNEVLYYKALSDICAYDGSFPASVSDSLGDVRYGAAVAGGHDGKYYISMRDGDNAYHLFVFDTAKKLWHREDDTNAMCFATQNDELYYIDADSKEIIAATGAAGTQEDSVSWSATTGIIGYTTVEQKYVSRFNLRMKLPHGSKADMYIQYDSDGVWHHCGHMNGVGTKSFMLPVRPRRCDHFQFRIEGVGEIRVYSFAKIFETGSDVG